MSKVVGRPFPKGVSGNPGGRARELVSQVREKFRDDVPKIVEVLRDLAIGKVPDGYVEEIKTSDRIKAASEVLDRVLGKAPQDIEVTDVTENQRRMLEALAMTPHQRRQALAAAQDSTASDEAGNETAAGDDAPTESAEHESAEHDDV